MILLNPMEAQGKPQEALDIREQGRYNQYLERLSGKGADLDKEEREDYRRLSEKLNQGVQGASAKLSPSEMELRAALNRWKTKAGEPGVRDWQPASRYGELLDDLNERIREETTPTGWAERHKTLRGL